MKNLDLELLRTFVSIAEEESFSVAAERVHRTQSAVSQQMKRLESQLGQPLFEKLGRNKKLTPQGLKLLGYAGRMITLNDEVLASFRSDDMQGSIRIGAPHDLAETLLPNMLSRFARSYPQLKMEIHVGRSPFLMQALKRREIDMTLSTRRDPDHPGMVLRTSPTVWICAHDFHFNPALPIPLVLADEPSLYRELALQHLNRLRLPWHISYLAPTLVGIKAAVRAGLGITARSIDMLGPDLRVLGDAEGLPRLPDVNFHLYLANENVSAAAQRLFELLGGDIGDRLTPQ